jgi:hypothetical protein
MELHLESHQDQKGEKDQQIPQVLHGRTDSQNQNLESEIGSENQHRSS